MTKIKEMIKILYIKILRNLFAKRANGKLYYFTLGNCLPAPLPTEKELELLMLAQNGNEKAKQALVEHNLRLVVYIAKKFDNSSVLMDDLISIGSIGLIKAVNSYKADKNIKLATFASKCIENEILMFLRKTVKCKAEVSLDEPLNTDSDGNELQLTDVLGASDEDVYESCEQKMMSKELYKAISKLKANEQMIIELRFGLNDKNEKTQKEVADMLGISQSYISRLEKKIIKKLKKDIVQIG